MSSLTCKVSNKNDTYSPVCFPVHYTLTDLAHVLEFHLVDVPEYGIFNYCLLNPYTHHFYLISRLLHEQ
jgi:hypothetical protein